ncbi:MAG: phosphatase PAP2 family protein [bacterium]
MRGFDIKKSAIIIFTIIALGFVFSDYVINLDTIFDNFMSGIRTVTGMKFFGWLTILGDKYVISFLALVLTYFLWRLPLSGSRFLRVFWISFLLDVSTGAVLKYIVGRDRPLGAEVYEGFTYSFPSGHAIASIFFYGFIAVAMNRLTKIDIKLKYLTNFICFILVFLISFSRLYLGVHYLSDVVAGLAIGWFWLNTILYFTRDIQIERKINIVNVKS